jgi:Flp pilus assembly protein TadB
MKTLAILCIFIATCLYFPLPQRSSLKLPPSEPKAFVEIAARVPSSGEILQTLEIIRLGISSGMTISDALQYAQKHSPRAASQEIEQVLNQFRMGFPLSRGLEEVATANPRWRSISDTLIASLHSGSPITEQLADVEFVLQSSIDTEKLKRIKSVAVKSVLPLGACFLPAFILLAVIPIIAGLIGGLTQ